MNIIPLSGLWSENAAGTVSGYQEHLKDVSLLRAITAVQRMKDGTNQEQYVLTISWQVLDSLSSYLCQVGVGYFFLFRKIIARIFQIQKGNYCKHLRKLFKFGNFAAFPPACNFIA